MESAYAEFQPPSIATRNYSGSGRVGLGRVGPGQSKSDDRASSVQLQLQLPAETELGNIFFKFFTYHKKIFLVIGKIFSSEES